MKFCKSLQRMMDISDPEWAPYYTNYKMLKKIIKELPHQHELEEGHNAKPRPESPTTPPLVSAPCPPSERQCSGENSASESPPPPVEAASAIHPSEPATLDANLLAAIVTNPVEQNFFRLLHQEVRKVSYFYHKLMHELRIRYDRIHYNVHQLLSFDENPERTDAAPPSTYSVFRLLQEEEEGAKDEARNPASVARTHPSNTLTSSTTRADRERNASRDNPRRQHHYFLCNQSIYKLYRDLMFLELYSIMALTSFSKILKKHDKVTGYRTKYAFMTKIVLPANFVVSPMQPMMEQCMEWYDHISYRWMREQEAEDDASLLFLDMIRRLRSHIPPPTE